MYKEPGVLVSGHYQQKYGYVTSRPEGRNDWLMIFTVEGEGNFQIGSFHHHSHAGDVVIIKPNTAHMYEVRENQSWEFYWSHFIPAPDWFQFFTFSEPEKGMYTLHITDSSIQKRIIHAFQNIINDHFDSSSYQKDLLLNDLHQIILLLARENWNNVFYNYDPRITEVMDVMKHRFAENLSVQELASYAALSESRFANLFKQQVGDTVISTLIKIRMQRAILLLKHTNKQISEIAHEVGFENPFYFTRKFKQLHGISPSEYRNQFREE
ncbi:MAG TPA: helix-turn-helix domain-containing protein [Bacillaceae bacterium]|nr:helix-turn-helix domain-containing protein [Paenibacillus bovis]HLU21241.1 helix-turn-helix domain-containing protein [Bacillaceae bacterium]